VAPISLDPKKTNKIEKYTRGGSSKGIDRSQALKLLDPSGKQRDIRRQHHWILQKQTRKKTNILKADPLMGVTIK